MYNRYVPQADGSYRRSRHPDACATPPPPPEPPPIPEPPPGPEPPSGRPPADDHRQEPFLRQLLPRDFDTGDLIVLLLLLLMAGERPEDRTNAILTLALYFLM